MEYTHLLVCAALICGCNAASLLHGETQFSGNSPSPAVRLSTQAPPPIDGLERGLYNAQSDEQNDQRRVHFVYPTRGNIRQSFSLETTTSATTPHFEALRNDSDHSRTVYINNQRVKAEDPQDVAKAFNSLKRGRTVDYGSSTPGRSYEERSETTARRVGRISETTARSVGQESGPSVHVQQIPYRRWSTDSNIIREEDLDGSLGSFSYATPTPTPGRPLDYRGNIRYTVPTESPYEASYETSRHGKHLQTSTYSPDISNRRAFIPPTTYKPLFSPNLNEYSFSFRTQNHTREEVGNSQGHFRGSIKYKNTYGRDKQIHYDATPDRGIVTSEQPIFAVSGRSGFVSPVSSPRPFAPNSNSYPFLSPSPYEPTEPIPSTTVAYDNDIRYGKSYPSTERYPVVTPTPYTPRRLPTPDGSYGFSFNAGDHERQEARDRDGNVKGMYSFISPEGETRTVHYEANAQNGFVAKGRHLPVQEGRIIPGNSPYSYAAQEQGTYFFSYDAGNHARQEVRDDDGNVRGSFSFHTPDGFKKTIHYRANPEDGFHIEREDIARIQ